MPASRSRTTEWRRSLEQLRDRGGAIEIAVAHDEFAGNELSETFNNVADLVWRVRVLDITDECFSVDLPFALGRPVELPDDTTLVGAIGADEAGRQLRAALEQDCVACDTHVTTTEIGKSHI